MSKATGSHARQLLFKPRPFVLASPLASSGSSPSAASLFALFRRHDGNEGDEGDEGDEGNEGDEGDEGGGSRGGSKETPPPADADDGANGDEGNEGDEGDEGGFFRTSTSSSMSSVECISVGSSYAFQDMTDAHTTATVDMLLELCRQDTTPELRAVELAAEGAGQVVARAVADAQAACISEGNTFGCSSASATASAWAEAAAEAHATAVARGQGTCACLANAGALSIGQAAEFVGLVADAFARAEVTACSSGDQTSFAIAYATCAAEAYARIVVQAYAEALVVNDCFDATATAEISAVTSLEYTVIEGCQQEDTAGGVATGVTNGSFAEVVATEQ
eukprot:jgi/Ulvmu1/6750/UM030_0085.1